MMPATVKNVAFLTVIRWPRSLGRAARPVILGLGTERPG